MKRTQMLGLTFLAALMAFALAAGYASTSAAQKTEGSADKAKAPSGRLPNYYTRVTTEDQQEKLRDVAKKYAPKIQQKRDELAALLAERNAELDELLTAEQKAEVAKLRAEAAARRGTASAAASDNEGSDKAKSKKAKSKKAA